MLKEAEKISPKEMASLLLRHSTPSPTSAKKRHQSDDIFIERILGKKHKTSLSSKRSLPAQPLSAPTEQIDGKVHPRERTGLCPTGSDPSKERLTGSDQKVWRGHSESETCFYDSLIIDGKTMTVSMKCKLKGPGRIILHFSEPTFAREIPPANPCHILAMQRNLLDIKLLVLSCSHYPHLMPF